jgi:hypothetical protein
MIKKKPMTQTSTRQGLLSHKTNRRRVPVRAADAKNSVKNILLWNSYLPSDCVRTMVRMGWDYTT